MGRRNKKGNKIDGWINLNKPVGLTSTQALGKLRYALYAQKAGHAGTLDPLASGVLPVALGEATKTIPYIQDALKTYEFEITWGQQRSTDDNEGEIIAESDNRPSQSDIEALLPELTGDIEQIPPQFSAVKIDGQRAYDLARDGEQVDIKPRQVFIESIEIIRHPVESRDLPVCGTDIPACAGITSFEVTCGKGTYIRSIARDMGQKLGCYGYISNLQRTAVGPFTLENAISLDFFADISDKTALEEILLPVQTALDDIPALALNDGEASRLKNGQTLSFIARPDQQRLKDAGIQREDTALATYKGQPLALVTIEGPDIQPLRVLNM